MPTIGRRPGRFSRLFFFYSLSHSQKEGEKEQGRVLSSFLPLFWKRRWGEKMPFFIPSFIFLMTRGKKGEEYEWISAPVSPIFRKKKAERKEERNNPWFSTFSKRRKEEKIRKKKWVISSIFEKEKWERKEEEYAFSFVPHFLPKRKGAWIKKGSVRFFFIFYFFSFSEQENGEGKEGEREDYEISRKSILRSGLLAFSFWTAFFEARTRS